MLDKYWRMYVDFKIAEYYYSFYLHSSKRIEFGISAFCPLASTTSISAWCIWTQLSKLWAAIIAVAQAISILKPLFPFAKRVSAAEYILQEIRPLLRDVDATWGYDGSLIPNGEIGPYIKQYEARYDAIEERFSSTKLFPQNKKLHDMAQENAVQYLTNRFGIDKEGVVYQ